MKAPRKPQELVIYAQVVHDAMAANAATFPTPNPPLPKLQALIDDLTTKQARTRMAVGGITRRNTAQDKLVAGLNKERVYVEEVATGDPENAAVIAERAGMQLRKTATSPLKPPLSLDHGPVSGCVLAVVAAIKGATAYYWEYRLNEGVTWIVLPHTTRANTKIEDLAPGATAHVRFRALLPAGLTDWSAPVPIIVI